MKKNKIDIDAISKQVIKQALDGAQADIDRYLNEIADDVIKKYYEDYEPKHYSRTDNFWEKSYYLTHHQNQGGGGRRQYRYISLWFSPEKMKPVYHSYLKRRKRALFPVDQVFYQNFNHGYHGRVVGRGLIGDAWWIRGDRNYVPLTGLNEQWNKLKRQGKKKFNQKMDEKIIAALDDVVQKLDDQLVELIDDFMLKL